MRPAPKLTQLHRYPIVSGTALLATGVTLLWWTNTDISPLLEDAMIRRGEFWRLLTSIFPHAGFLHLAFNLYWLWVFGSKVEEVFGHAKALALILLFAFIPNAFEFALADGGVGLSGVGYGLCGFLWVLSRRDERFQDAVDSRTIQLFVGWFFVCIVGTITNIMPVANVAHGVGAIVGVLTGFAVALPERRTQISTCITVLFFVGLWGSTVGRPKVNLSKAGGADEAYRGYQALVANRNQEAASWLRDAVRYKPTDGGYWYNLALAYERLGDKRVSSAAYTTAAERGQSMAQFRLGTLYRDGYLDHSKDYGQAMDWFRKAAAQGNTDALNELAWEYATAEDSSVRNAPAALELAQKMAGLEREHPDPSHLDTLAEAYYVNRQFANAIATEQRAIALAAADAKPKFEEQLKKYQYATNAEARETHKRVRPRGTQE